MSSPSSYDSSARAEELYRSAELRARSAKSNIKPRELNGPRLDEADDASLLLVAFRELENRAVRVDLLPAELFADVGWVILLELFIAELQKSDIITASDASHWQVSEATAVRLIAALIETDLVWRETNRSDAAPYVLQLTEQGHDVIRKILTDHQ